jgi:hypothetical protein
MLKIIKTVNDEKFYTFLPNWVVGDWGWTGEK